MTKQEYYLNKYSCSYHNAHMSVHASAPEEPCLASLQFWLSGSKHRLFTLLNLFLYDKVLIWLKGKLSTSDRKLLQVVAILLQNGIHIIIAGLVVTRKKDDICVTSKEEYCYICIQFSSEQNKKIESKEGISA